MKKERQQDILSYLIKHNEVSIEQLANFFKVSTMTIRRDVNELEARKLLKKDKNVISAYNIRYYQEDINYRKSLYSQEKLSIAQKACSLIKRGDIIAIDAGSTTEYMGTFLNELQDITLITNDFNLINKVKDNDSIIKYFAGGKVEGNYNYSTLGSLNNNFYSHFVIDKLFLGAVSIDFSDGASHANYEMCMTKRSMIEYSKEIIFLVDHTKFKDSSNYRICPIEKIDIIVSDSQFNPDKYLIPKKIKIVQ